MPKIRKVRIVNFEYNDGKRLIADELYNFANRDDDDALNVLINLANGGGKSVLVQLMMQPIIPKAKVAGRRIESFFTKPTDHCFVLLEWQKDNSSEKLLTGIAMAARNASSEDENARGMSVKYYTFYSNYTSDHSNYSIVNLPLSNWEHGRFIPADFEAVRTIAKRSNGALVYYRDDDNGAWKHKLEEYGLVQNEWRTMEKLNSEEGGFGKFFGDFKTSDQLVDNLLIRTIEDKEFFFSFEREQWLPAMVPIFTHEQMKLILEQNRPFSGSIAFYSEASFADRTNYISLLHQQKEQLVQQHVRLLAGASQLRLQIADAEAFTYAESWKVEQQGLVHQWTTQIARLSEKQVALEEEKTRLHQEKRALAAQLQDFRLELTAAENNLRQLQEIRLQISRELELMAQISTQKQALAEAENHLSQLEKTLEALRRTEEDLTRTVNTLTDLVAQLHQAETETSGARETDRLPGSWDELIRQYRQLLDTASRELAELRHRLQEKHSRRSDYLHELDKRAISEELYAHVVHSDEAERALRQAAKDLEVRFADAGTRHQQAAEQNGFAKGQLVLAEKDLIPYGAPLDKSDVGGNFEGRLQSLQDTRKQVLHQQRIHAKLESNMSHTLERLSDRLQGCVRPEPIASVVLENDFTTQCTTATGELEQCKKQLAASEKLVSDEFRMLRQQFQDTACGVLDSVVSMAELLEKKLRGDRYFTLTDLIDSNISNAQRAISQIMTDLMEFEHHHHDLIHQCTLQGQRIYEGLKQMSTSYRVTVYDGKPKKTMIRFDLPETVDPEAAASAITDEIDKGTRELVAAMSNSSEQEIVNLAKRIVSSRNLVRKYLRQESIEVHAFKIDQNPQNAGYRSWKQTQVNNSGAEKFIVYFAVILSLMSYTREELGGIRDKELRSVLILDNPFGATSSRHILEPMFAIARHFRVQMVCLSDINKSDVINCFDIVIKAIVKKRAMSSSELLTHEVNEVIDHGFYRAEQLSLL